MASLTNAVTIHRPPRDIWPWLVQMGAGRAGWYSYDCIDNGGRPSATEVLPTFQSPSIGGVFPWLPGAQEGFILEQQEPAYFLVLAARSPSGSCLSTWTFVLDETAPGQTRLIVRARGSRAYEFHRLPAWLVGLIVPLVHFVMQRKQLLGIARRAEQAGDSDRLAGLGSSSTQAVS
jgi:hypothetical protein